jgi:hypothetical protein
MDAHPLPAHRVEVDVPVLDGIVEDSRKAIEHLAHRRRAERYRAPPATVANIGAGLDRLAQFLRLAQQVSLEGEAQIAVDLIEAKVTEERQGSDPQLERAYGVTRFRLRSRKLIASSDTRYLAARVAASP